MTIQGCKNGEHRKPYNMQGKRHAKQEEHKILKKRSKLLDKHEVAAWFKKPCCINECVWWGFSIEKMMVIRGRYVMQIKKERTTWLHTLAASAYFKEPGGKAYWAWNIMGNQVCTYGVTKILGCSHRRLMAAQQHHTSETYLHGKTGMKIAPDKWKINWGKDMDEYIDFEIETLGDKSPTDNTVHMPSYV